MTDRSSHRWLYVGIFLVVAGCAAVVIGQAASGVAMMQSFEAIARSDATPRPSDLSAGISTAMFLSAGTWVIGGGLGAVGFVVLVAHAIRQSRRRDEPPIAAEAVAGGGEPPG